MSSRVLLVLVAVLSASASATLVDLVFAPAGREPIARLVFPELRSGELVELRWLGENDNATLRVADGGFAFEGPDGRAARVDATAAHALFATVEALEGRRRKQVPPSDTARSSLAIVVGTNVIAFELSAAPDAADYGWLVRDGVSMMIPAYAARLLLTGPRRVVNRRLLSDCPVNRLSRLVIGDGADEALVIAGPPWTAREAAGSTMSLDPAKVRELVGALCRIEVARESASTARNASGRVDVAFDDREQSLEYRGSCSGGGVALTDGTWGGCLSERYRPLFVEHDPTPLVDTRLLTGGYDDALISLAIARDGQRLELSQRDGWAVGEDSMTEAELLRWVHGLSSPSPLPASAAAAAESAPVVTVEVAFHGGGSRALHVYSVGDGYVARRDGESVFWPLDPESVARIVPDARVFRDQVVLPYAETELVRAEARTASSRSPQIIERGELLGDWSSPNRASMDKEAALEFVRVVSQLSGSWVASASDLSLPPTRTVDLRYRRSGRIEDERLEVRTNQDGECFVHSRWADAALSQAQCRALLRSWLEATQ